jgi:hypothetical protein
LLLAEFDKGTLSIVKGKIASYHDLTAGGYQVEHAVYRCNIDCPPLNMSDSIVVQRTYTRKAPPAAAAATIAASRLAEGASR